MELLFETRPNLTGFNGQFIFVQHEPTIHPGPVLLPDSPCDCKGVSVYGTVLRDGGRLRMWYMAHPDAYDYEHDMSAVAYAESDNGLTWRKTPIDVLKHGDSPSNYTDLGLHCASVFIDPDSPPTHRYRATGCGYKGLLLVNPRVTDMGYYTAHSADGLKWTLDAGKPRWYCQDVIASVYHPWHRRAMVAMKWTRRVGRIRRRAMYTAEFRDGVYGEPVSALIPDEFDDVCAQARGRATCDYYGTGLMPAGSGTVAFIWKFWHDLPYTSYEDGLVALYGVSDVTLAYQIGPGHRWLHVPGRPIFIDHEAYPWMRGFVTTASAPVEVGDEHWLYISGYPYSHGFHSDANWKPTKWAQHIRASTDKGGIGVAKWPKWRLFGMEADPEGQFDIDLGKLDRPVRLRVNYTTRPGGRVRAQVCDDAKKTLDTCVPLTGQAIAGEVRWASGDTIAPAHDGKNTVVRLHLEIATAYAYEIVPV